MKAFNKHLLEKYYNGSCSPEQAKEVMNWLDSPDGQKYLDEKIQTELEEWEEEEGNDKSEQNDSSTQPSSNDSLDSALLFQKIINRLGWNSLVTRQIYFIKPLFQIAAFLLMIMTATLIYVNIDSNSTEGVITDAVIYSTTTEEQKRITLRDGSVVRLNSNSSLMLDHGYNTDMRSVNLTGEAFFDVVHHTVKPFRIHSGQSVIEVLGTSFNVKLNSDQTEVNVAVAEGKVSIRHNADLIERSEILEEGQFASLNTISREIYTDDKGIDNYLAWMSGRMVFKQLTMSQVCTQLYRLYGVTCDFVGERIQNRKLTANFSSTNVEKTLSVIAATLDLRYEQKGDQVVWYGE